MLSRKRAHDRETQKVIHAEDLDSDSEDEAPFKRRRTTDSEEETWSLSDEYVKARNEVAELNAELEAEIRENESLDYWRSHWFHEAMRNGENLAIQVKEKKEMRAEFLEAAVKVFAYQQKCLDTIATQFSKEGISKPSKMVEESFTEGLEAFFTEREMQMIRARLADQ